MPKVFPSGQSDNTDCASFGLCSLILGTGANAPREGQPQLQTVDDDLHAVVEHATWVGVVLRFGSRKDLGQFCIALQWRLVQSGELYARERLALSEIFQRPFPAWATGRRRPHLERDGNSI